MAFKQWINLFVLALVWGTSFAWIKIAEYQIGPLTLVAWRLLLGLLCVLLFVLAKRITIHLSLSDWFGLALLAILNPGATFVLIAWSEVLVDSAVVSILNATGPLFTMLLAHKFLKDDRINSYRLIGLILGFIGVIILVSRERNLSFVMFQRNIHGQAMVLGAMLCLASGAVFTQRSLQHIEPSILSLSTMMFATILAWPLAWLVEGPIHIAYEPITWIALLWLGILGSGLALLLYFSLINRVGSTRTNLVTYLTALIGVAVGVVVLRERFDYYLLLGGAFILTGITIVNRR